VVASIPQRYASRLSVVHSVANARSGSSMFWASAAVGAGSGAGTRSRSVRSTTWAISCSHSLSEGAVPAATPASGTPVGVGFVGCVGVLAPLEHATANTSQAIVLTVHRC